MPKDYYKAAMVIFTIQILLLAVLVNGVVVERFGTFPYPAIVGSLPILGIVIFILAIASIFVIRSLYLNSLRIQRHQLDALRFQHIEEQNRIYQQHSHDLHNHMTVIAGLAQLGKMEKLRGYILSYLENFNKSVINVRTGVKELDVLFSAKISEAKNKDIDVSYKCLTEVICRQDQIIGLTAILANALDNAIRASQEADQIKTLDIKISADAVDYIFEIANTFSPKVDLKNKIQIEGFTTKPGSRGEGVSIIRRTVNRFQGRMQYFIVDGHCRLKVELPRLVLE